MQTPNTPAMPVNQAIARLRAYGPTALNLSECMALVESKSKHVREHKPALIRQLAIMMEPRPAYQERITASAQAFQILRERIALSLREEFYCIFLRRNNTLIDCQQVSVGGASGCIVDPKVVFRACFQLPEVVHAIILAHNHPSGNNNPSPQDIDITRKIKQGGQVLDIEVLDHLIISGPQSYYSLGENGQM